MIHSFKYYLVSTVIFFGLSTFTSAKGGGADASSLTSNRIGARTNTSYVDGVATTVGVIRVRRRHENDMDFAKYNPFYWQGRATSFRVEDHTTRGEHKIVFTLKTEWPQDNIPTRGPDFSAMYVGKPLANEVDRSKFLLNARMSPSSRSGDNTEFKFVLDKNWFQAYPERLQKGRPLTFEFRFFNNENFEGWRKQKDFSDHTISAYYSEFLRIRIGEPGIHIDAFDGTHNLGESIRYAGGWTTSPTTRVEPWGALQQQAFNLTPGNAKNFLLGRTWFHTDFITGQHISDAADDKPAVFFPETQDQRAGYAASAYNVSSCNRCHIANGTALIDFGSKELEIDTTIVKTFDPETGDKHNDYGRQLQTEGPDREGVLTITGMQSKKITLEDGTTVQLNKPLFAIDKTKNSPALLSVRKPPALIGLGLIDSIPAAEIKNQAEISQGHIRLVNGKLGRFGWKGEVATLKDQIKNALLNDMGVRSMSFEKLDCVEPCIEGKGVLDEEAVDLLETYVALLAVPPRFKPKNEDVLAGEKIFNDLGCQQCHRGSWTTGISKFPELTEQKIFPYSDFLLHDLGPGLADGTNGAYSQLWRTAPLWGLKNAKHATDHHPGAFKPGDTNVTYQDTHQAVEQNRYQFLHDGRAESIIEAILWHGGEAASSVEAYKKLNIKDRQKLEAFLWDL